MIKIEVAPIIYYKDCHVDITEDLENCNKAIESCELEYKLSIMFALFGCFGGWFFSLYLISLLLK